MNTRQYASATPIIGHRYGNYEIVHFLASGGFAKVYLAKHRYLDTSAAIKIANSQATEKDRRHFLTEARIASRLIHPNIVRLLDFGIEDDQAYSLATAACFLLAGTLGIACESPLLFTCVYCILLCFSTATALTVHIRYK